MLGLQSRKSNLIVHRVRTSPLILEYSREKVRDASNSVRRGGDAIGGLGSSVPLRRGVASARRRDGSRGLAAVLCLESASGQGLSAIARQDRAARRFRRAPYRPAGTSA